MFELIDITWSSQLSVRYKAGCGELIDKTFKKLSYGFVRGLQQFLLKYRTNIFPVELWLHKAAWIFKTSKPYN